MPVKGISSSSLFVELDFLLGHRRSRARSAARAARRSRPAGPRPRPRSSARSRRAAGPSALTASPSTLERDLGLEPVDPHQREAPRQRRALRLVGLDRHRLGEDLPQVDRARELGRAHSVIAPASSVLLSSAATWSSNACTRAASAAVSRALEHRHVARAAPPRARAGRGSRAPRAARRAGRRAPRPACRPACRRPRRRRRSRAAGRPCPRRTARSAAPPRRASTRSRSSRSSTSARITVIMSKRPGTVSATPSSRYQRRARARARPSGATAAAAPRAGRAGGGFERNRRASMDIGDKCVPIHRLFNPRRPSAIAWRRASP